MRIYADGSALIRYLAGVPQSDEWNRWAAEREADLLVTSLSLSELRAAAAGQPTDVRLRALDVADRLTEVRYFDQALRVASMVTGVLSSFGALHLGVAAAHPEVDTLATYDARLAQVAQMYHLRVVSPGLADQWFAA
ncbi:PIN domain-containing protein [Cellulomonas sp. NPDC089187]|uniref:PIN domain-containing protein n=1 Tax=Cellulomonas sp. NPDC089187 TaxID=3154970 RepID=UPI00342E08D6